MSYSLKTVLKGSSIYAIGEIITKATGIILIPVFTRILTPNDYGVLGYMQFVLQLLAVILLFGFHGAQTRYIYEHKKEIQKQGVFLFNINLLLALILSLFIAFTTLYGEKIWSLISSGRIAFRPYFILVMWTLFFQIFNQLVISFYLAKKRYRQTAVMQGIQFGLIAVLSLIFIITFNNKVEGRLFGVLIGQIIFFIIFYYKYAKNFVLVLNKSNFRYALVFGIPIIFHLLAGKVMTSIDRVILERYVPISRLGIYTLGYQIGMIMNVLTISFNKAFQPNYYELMDLKSIKKKKEFRKILDLWIIIIGGICLFGILWTKEIMYILVPQSYYEAISIIPIVLFSYLINGLYMFASAPLFYYKKTKYLPFITGFSALLNTVLNLLLIPKYGIYGAVYTTLFTYIVQATNTWLISRKYFNPNYNFIMLFIIFSVIYLSVLLIKIDSNNIIFYSVKIIYLFIYLVICVFLFQNELDIRKLLKRIFKLT